MGHFGTPTRAGMRFFWSFYIPPRENPHKMRLKQYFSTERWYKMSNTAGKF
jgi:hypothetical protein